jgi:hypothetical protein
MKRILLVLGIAVTLSVNSCKRFTENHKVDPHDLLAADKYSKLTVEVQSFEGQEPTSATLQNIEDFLETRLNKPDGINIISTSINPARKERYSLEDIRDLEEEHRTRYSSKSHASMYFLLVDGEYAANAGNSVTLGVAYGSTSMVLFHASISKHAGGLGQPSKTSLESTVAIHEIGHILGLVNNGTAMETDHEDHANVRHCNNKDCIMYYQAETTDMLANFVGTIPPLDSNCIKDLQKNGGK